MERTTTPSKILIGLALVAVLLGAFVLIFAVTAWPRMAFVDELSLASKYDPPFDSVRQQDPKYVHLYQVTDVLIGQRDRAAWLLLCTLGLSLLGVGAILLGWSIDRERLWRRKGRPDRQDIDSRA